MTDQEMNKYIASQPPSFRDERLWWRFIGAIEVMLISKPNKVRRFFCAPRFQLGEITKVWPGDNIDIAVVWFGGKIEIYHLSKLTQSELRSIHEFLIQRLNYEVQ